MVSTDKRVEVGVTILPVYEFPPVYMFPVYVRKNIRSSVESWDDVTFPTGLAGLITSLHREGPS